LARLQGCLVGINTDNLGVQNGLLVLISNSNVCEIVNNLLGIHQQTVTDLWMFSKILAKPPAFLGIQDLH
jgi:hypothetical protein